ncbi:MAG: FecR domain-containing protein [Bryobacterales bacterium]|nr:FecR domain-containing protein [Bryobacterales bacterium]
MRAIIGLSRGLALGLLMLACLSGSAQDAFVGSVKISTGQPQVIRGSEAIPATPGMRLQLKDSLRTGPESRIGVILRDGTRISLGPDSELALETFLFEPGKGEFGLLLKLFRGVAAFISGKIVELSPDSATVDTPVGIIGLRGTKFAVALGAR